MPDSATPSRRPSRWASSCRSIPTTRTPRVARSDHQPGAVRSRSASPMSARSTWPRRTRLRPPAASTASRCRSPRSSISTARSSRSTSPSASECCRRTRRRRSTTSCAASSSRAASATPTAPALRVPSAAKTGTTQDNKAVWYNGYTPELSTAAMIAGVNGKGLPKSLSGVTINGRLPQLQRRRRQLAGRTDVEEGDGRRPGLPGAVELRPSAQGSARAAQEEDKKRRTTTTTTRPRRGP